MKLPEFLIDHPDGEIRLVGHRIGLYTVVREYQAGHSAEQIAAEYPSLPLDLIRQVIFFYLKTRAEVDVYIETCRVEIERQASIPPGPGVLKVRQLMARIQQADREHGTEPGWSALSLLEKLRRIEQETRAGTT